MARMERPTTESTNPCTKFIQWKSNEKQFAYFDKTLGDKSKGEKGKDVFLPLPFKFLFLEHYHTVKGWHGASDKGIYANEVFILSKEPLTVKTFGGLTVAEGLYKDIKNEVNVAGGTYHRSIYIMLEDGEIANLQLKGAVVGGIKKEQAISKRDVKGYSDFYNANNKLMDNQWIIINSAEDAKKGATKYSIPVFEMGEVISPTDNDNADECVTKLVTHMKVYKDEEVLVEADENEELDY